MDGFVIFAQHSHQAFLDTRALPILFLFPHNAGFIIGNRRERNPEQQLMH